MGKIVVKINPTDAIKKKMIPGWTSDEEMSEQQRVIYNKAVYIVGPYSVFHDKAFMPYLTGVYRDHNRLVLNKLLRMNNLGAGPIFAQFHDGFWMTEAELKMYCMSDAYSSLMNEVSSGMVILEKDDGSLVTLEELMGYVGDPAGSNPAGGKTSGEVPVTDKDYVTEPPSQYTVYELGSSVETFTVRNTDASKSSIFEIDLPNDSLPSVYFEDGNGQPLEYLQSAPDWAEGESYQVSIYNNKVAVAKLVQA